MNKIQQKKVDSLLRHFEKESQIVPRWSTDLDIFEAAIQQYKLKKKKNISASVRNIEELQVVLKYYQSFNYLEFNSGRIDSETYKKVIILLETCNRIKNLALKYLPYVDSTLSFADINVTNSFKITHSSGFKKRYWTITMPKAKEIILGDIDYYQLIYIRQATEIVDFRQNYSQLNIEKYTCKLPLSFDCNLCESELKSIVIDKSELTDIPMWITKLPRLKVLQIGNRDFPLSKTEAIKQSLPNCYILFD